jgi:uncharacterized protein YjbJ (UPF0337 family)
MTDPRVPGLGLQIRGKAKEQWGKLTDDDLKQLEGNAQQLAGKLQERYGMAREEAERQAKKFREQMNWNPPADDSEQGDEQ